LEKEEMEDGRKTKHIRLEDGSQKTLAEGSLEEGRERRRQEDKFIRLEDDSQKDERKIT
jgi:hypothetical protein